MTNAHRISFLPALAAAFMLVFARIGTMVMLLPGLGEVNIPVACRLAIALALTLICCRCIAPPTMSICSDRRRCWCMLVQEILIGVVLGLTARRDVSALQVAGSVVAQQLGLGFVTAVDPTQGQQGVLIGNFLTILGVTLLFATDTAPSGDCRAQRQLHYFSPGE